VGYGTQRKRDVTGSVVSVNEMALREVPVANLQQALQGRAAGVEVQRAGTSPGANAVIRIRGMRSILGSNDPLFVVDGIPFQGSLNDINPDDVASIDVLKDASATAIYGSRGANGVILVTTKRGRTGDTRVSYSGYYGISNVANKYPVFSADEYRAMRDLSPWGGGYLPDELESIASGRTTDWQDLMYETAMRTDHNITVSGGQNGNSFSLGGGYYKETAVLPCQDFTRYSVRATIDSRVGRNIKVGITTLNQVSTTNGSQFVNNGTMFPTLATSPLMPAYNDDGTVKFLPNGNIDDNNQPQWSPLLLKNNNNNWVDRIRRISTYNSLYGELQIVKGLRYRINLGLNFRQQQNAQFQSANTPTNPSYFRGNRGNTALVNNGEAWDYTVENLLYYDKTIAGKHRINFTALYSVQESRSHNTQVSKDSITEDFVQFYNLAQSSPTPAANVTGTESSWGLLSYMARVNYSFDDRYMATITARVDGSSRLAEGKKW
ncbi:MAG TPA: SusC/RagA family TonB-linked outer membrane protein, partial [Chitinophagaceae bacterium]|nr:SusC/RagA family TonB-linked outer membrane protein [Chitinophagaceae bacterium]